MDYDAVIKLLVTERSSNFFSLIGIPPDRTALKTELNRPVVLRLDHLSAGPDNDVLHIEFQATWREMRWRMLEYYSAIATYRDLAALPSSGKRAAPSVKQFVILMGRATSMQGNLRRDNISFDFEVIYLNQIDPNKTLLKSDDPYDICLGLLCVDGISKTDLRRACERILEVNANDQDLARDAFALLLAVAQLLRVSQILENDFRRMRMQIDIHDSPVLLQFQEENRLFGKLEALREHLFELGDELDEDDEAFLKSLDRTDVSEISRRLRGGEEWRAIRGYRPGRLPGE